MFCTLLLVYLDAISITGSDIRGISAVKTHLKKVFDVKDLGALKYFLEIEIARSRKGISLSQRKYVSDLLKDTGKMECRPASSPMDPNTLFVAELGQPLKDPSKY